MCQPHLMKLKNLRITDSNVRVAGLKLFNAYKHAIQLAQQNEFKTEFKPRKHQVGFITPE